MHRRFVTASATLLASCLLVTACQQKGETRTIKGSPIGCVTLGAFRTLEESIARNDANRRNFLMMSDQCLLLGGREYWGAERVDAKTAMIRVSTGTGSVTLYVDATTVQEAL